MGVVLNALTDEDVVVVMVEGALPAVALHVLILWKLLLLLQQKKTILLAMIMKLYPVVLPPVAGHVVEE